MLCSYHLWPVTVPVPPAPVRARALKQTKSFADSNDGALPVGLDESSLCSSMRLCILDDDADAARSAIACFDCLSQEHQVHTIVIIISCCHHQPLLPSFFSSAQSCSCSFRNSGCISLLPHDIFSHHVHFCYRSLERSSALRILCCCDMRVFALQLKCQS